MRRAPLVPTALALMAGIAVARLAPGLPIGVWVGGMAAATLAGGLMLIAGTKRYERILGALFLAVVFVAGGLRSIVADPTRDELDWSHHCTPPNYLEIKLKETPVPREKSYRARAEVVNVDNIGVRGRMTLYLRKDAQAAALRYGDRLLAHGYADTIRRTLYVTGDHYLVTASDSTSRRARIEQLRMRLLRRMQEGPLPRREAGVAEALTVGWRGDLDASTQAAYRDAGIAHLLAVSGLHVGLLAAMVGGLMFWTGRERRGRTVRGTVQLAAVWTFALLTGLAPSTIRAALMFSLFIISNILGRRTDRMNLLAACAMITLSADPDLLADTGWQLSYSAVAGILMARPVIHRYRNRLWQSAMVSLAATLATLPTVVATFHRLPAYSLITNLIVVPFAGVLLVLSLAYMAVPCPATAAPLGWALRATEWLTGQVAGLPGAVVEGLHPDGWATAGIAITTSLIFITLQILEFLKKKQKKS